MEEKNEAEFLDIEGTLQNSTPDVFQDNFCDGVQGYLRVKLE